MHKGTIKFLHDHFNELTSRERSLLRAFAVLRAADDQKKTVAPPRSVTKPDVPASVGKFFRNFPALWNATAKRLEIDPNTAPTKVGQGTMGTAYELPSGSVLKLTNDASEASAMLRLMKNPDPNFVKVTDVFAVTPEGRSPLCYAIEMEDLEQPAEYATRYCDAMFYWREIFSGVFAPIAADDADRFEKWVKKEGKVPKKDNDGDEKPSKSEDEVREILSYGSKVSSAQLDMMGQWYKEVANHLADIGVEFRDLHGDNVMRRGASPVVIDLGVSVLRGSETLPSVTG